MHKEPLLCGSKTSDDVLSLFPQPGKGLGLQYQALPLVRDSLLAHLPTVVGQTLSREGWGIPKALPVFPSPCHPAALGAIGETWDPGLGGVILEDPGDTLFPSVTSPLCSSRMGE